MSLIRKTCNKVVWLEHGIIKAIGPPEMVIEAYDGIEIEKRESRTHESSSEFQHLQDSTK
jgi:ABC-type polysaccharide/polyol phosphate transport system ATPase subunit